jgi:hypothetical protein
MLAVDSSGAFVYPAGAVQSGGQLLYFCSLFLSDGKKISGDFLSIFFSALISNFARSLVV